MQLLRDGDEDMQVVYNRLRTERIDIEIRKISYNIAEQMVGCWNTTETDFMSGMSRDGG